MTKILLTALAVSVMAAPEVAEFTPKQESQLIRCTITEEEETRLARMLYGEDRRCGDAEATMKQAAVVWCVFNRCDAWEQSIEEVVVHSQFHGYTEDQEHPDWAHEIVRDVALRYSLEQSGMKNVGRVLPKEYLFFSTAKDKHNKFRTGYRGGEYWDWSWENPYE